MRTTLFVALALVLACLQPASAAPLQNPTPAELLESVAKHYRDLDTYQSEGVITVDMDTGGMKMSITTTFTIRLRKPDLYLITWSQDMPMAAGPMAGAVWHDGTRRGFYMGANNSWSPMNTDAMALASATGVSGGAANTIPALFFPPMIEGMGSPLDRFENPVLEADATIEGEECWVVSAPSIVSKKETFWIAKSDRHVVKFARLLEQPDGGSLEMPEITDEKLEEAIRQMGMEVTEDSKRRMRQTMDQARDMMSNMEISGVSTELHETVSSPNLDASDFRYDLPEGAKRQESIMDSIPDMGGGGC